MRRTLPSDKLTIDYLQVNHILVPRASRLPASTQAAEKPWERGWVNHDINTRVLTLDPQTPRHACLAVYLKVAFQLNSFQWFALSMQFSALGNQAFKWTQRIDIVNPLESNFRLNFRYTVIFFILLRKKAGISYQLSNNAIMH